MTKNWKRLKKLGGFSSSYVNFLQIWYVILYFLSFSHRDELCNVKK